MNEPTTREFPNTARNAMMMYKMQKNIPASRGNSGKSIRGGGRMLVGQLSTVCQRAEKKILHVAFPKACREE